MVDDSQCGFETDGEQEPIKHDNKVVAIGNVRVRTEGDIRDEEGVTDNRHECDDAIEEVAVVSVDVVSQSSFYCFRVYAFFFFFFFTITNLYTAIKLFFCITTPSHTLCYVFTLFTL